MSDLVPRAEFGSSHSPAELETIAVLVAGDAARAIREASEAPVAIATKSSSTDVVTALDLEVEHLIRDALVESTPGASIVGEEHERLEGSTSIGWVVDPIDGTVNLMYDVPIVGVSLAATIDGQVVAGAVADIAHNEVFSTSLGTGARRNGSAIACSPSPHLAESLIATGFDYSAEARTGEAEHLRRVLPATRDVRCFGSAALHLCWAACGRVDGYYQHHVKVWDYAAGALIAREAGASVELPTQQNAGLILAASPTIFDGLRDLVT